MRYLCLICYDEKKHAALSRDEAEALAAEARDYVEELRRGGHYVASDALQSVRTATTLRTGNGRLTTTDGPFAETKEQLGGFILIEARDLNDAIRLAAKIPPRAWAALRCDRSRSRVAPRRTEEIDMSAHESTNIGRPRVATREEWLVARKDLLAREKEHTRQRDALNAARRRLPMVRVEKPYVFEGPAGHAGLVELFEGRRQLIVYHFMFEPDAPPPGKNGAPWVEGCPGCSFATDDLPDPVHLRARDTNLVLVSRARWSKIAPFKKRMGWTLPWYSSYGSDFNYDFHVTTDESKRPVEYNFEDKATLEREGLTYHLSGEQPGLSVFLRDGERIYHTYSTYGRGLDWFLGTNHLLDLTPYGRQEAFEDSPPGWPRGSESWPLHHDRYYAEPAAVDSCCHQTEEEATP